LYFVFLLKKELKNINCNLVLDYNFLFMVNRDLNLDYVLDKY